MSRPAHSFVAEIWESDSMDAWAFATVPTEVSEDIRLRTGPPRGFGSVRVETTLGTTTWHTSVFPDRKSGCYLLPVKKAVRRAEGVEAGDEVGLRLVLVDAEIG